MNDASKDQLEQLYAVDFYVFLSSSFLACDFVSTFGAPLVSGARRHVEADRGLLLRAWTWNLAVRRSLVIDKLSYLLHNPFYFI